MSIDPNLILQVFVGLLGLLTVIVGRRVGRYFAEGTRTQRVERYAVIAREVLALVALQGGVNQTHRDDHSASD